MEMRRADRQIVDQAEIETILSCADVVHLGMLDDGMPYVAPMNFGWEWTENAGLRLYLHSAREGRKIDCLASDNRVFAEISFEDGLIDGGDNPCRYGYRFGSVMGAGTAQLVEDVDEKVHGLELLMGSLTGREFEISPNQARTVAVIRVDIPDFTAKARL